LNTGIFDVITAPANHIVVCSGELVNPTAVYSTAEQTRLAQAKLSDKTVSRTEERKGWRLQLQQQKLGIINLKMLEIVGIIISFYFRWC
jgi:hypothetical protein